MEILKKKYMIWNKILLKRYNYGLDYVEEEKKLMIRGDKIRNWSWEIGEMVSS